MHRSIDQAADERPDSSWWIGLAAWVLLDGNYDDFSVGDQLQFALEFSFDRPAQLKALDKPGERKSRYLGRGSDYEIAGTLEHADPNPWSGAFVLDFGLLAYSQLRSATAAGAIRTGDWLEATVSLHVDPFMYRDVLAAQDTLPPLSYTWTVEAIELDRTPLIEVKHGHPRYVGPDEGPRFVTDPTRERWQAIDRTRMDSDNGKNYRLRCKLHSARADRPITRKRA